MFHFIRSAYSLCLALVKQVYELCLQNDTLAGELLATQAAMKCKYLVSPFISNITLLVQPTCQFACRDAVSGSYVTW